MSGFICKDDRCSVMSVSIVELGVVLVVVVVVVVEVVSVSLLVYFNNANVKSYNTCMYRSYYYRVIEEM